MATGAVETYEWSEGQVFTLSTCPTEGLCMALVCMCYVCRPSLPCNMAQLACPLRERGLKTIIG